MKRSIVALITAGTMASSRFAYHLTAYEGAGIYIHGFSPNLDMEF